MEKDRLNRYLNSVGKKCFAKYFRLFSDLEKANHEVAEQIKAECGYTTKACHSRTGHARLIIREGGASEALRLIVESKRVENETVELAQMHLDNII